MLRKRERERGGEGEVRLDLEIIIFNSAKIRAQGKVFIGIRIYKRLFIESTDLKSEI